MKIRGYSKPDIIEREQTHRESFDQLLNELESEGAAYEKDLTVEMISTPCSTQQSALNKNICPNNACRRNLSRLCAFLDDMNEDIMWLHEKVEQTNKLMLEMVASAYPPEEAQRASSSNAELNDTICLPLVSISDFQRTEEKLVHPQFRVELHRQLTVYDGQMETILSALMTDALACQFSWDGCSKQLRIKGTRIGAVLSDILIPLTLTEEENRSRERNLSHWFRNADDREGERIQGKYRTLSEL